MATIYRVEGMTCGGCASSVENAIKTVQPSAVVTVDLEAKQITVSGAADEQVAAAVDAAGFTFVGVV